MMIKRLQRKFEWTDKPAVLAKGLLRRYGAGVELAESVLSLDETGTFSPCKLRFVMNGGATKRPARFRILFNPPYLWINAARRRRATSTCVLVEGSTTLVNQTIISHLPTRHVSTNGSEKRVLERAEPPYSRTTWK